MAESNNLQEAVETQIMSQIWFQIETAATNAQCAKIYRDRVGKANRRFDLWMASVPVIGGICALINPYITVAATILTVISTAIKSLIPSLRQSNQDLIELDKIAEFYESYLVDCVHLYSKLFAEDITPSEARNQLYPIEKLAGEKSVILNRLVWDLSEIKDKVDNRSADIVQRRFGIIPPQDE